VRPTACKNWTNIYPLAATCMARILAGVPDSSAARPVCRSHRSTITSQQPGSISTSRARRTRFSAAGSVLPLPTKVLGQDVDLHRSESLGLRWARRRGGRLSHPRAPPPERPRDVIFAERTRYYAHVPARVSGCWSS
jgi:hypothetical protein